MLDVLSHTSHDFIPKACNLRIVHLIGILYRQEQFVIVHCRCMLHERLLLVNRKRSGLYGMVIREILRWYTRDMNCKVEINSTGCVIGENIRLLHSNIPFFICWSTSKSLWRSHGIYKICFYWIIDVQFRSRYIKYIKHIYVTNTDITL